MLERWKVKKKLKFVKEDIIEGLDNIDYGGDLIPPILIPF